MKNQLAGGRQHRLYIVIYSVQKKKLAISEGGSLTGDYCMCEEGFLPNTQAVLVGKCKKYTSNRES